MYDSNAIAALTGRIGWAPLRLPTSKVLSSDNEGSTGRLFNSFHAMAIAENVEEGMPVSNANTANESIDSAALNAYLKLITDQAILKVLGRVFDSNEAANYYINSAGCRVDLSTKDYSSLIISRPAAFDEVVGYQVAYDVLELMLTTSRSNLRQRAAVEGISLIAQQQGARDENGNVIIDGVFQKLESAYGKLSAILFPVANTRPKIRSASHLW